MTAPVISLSVCSVLKSIGWISAEISLIADSTNVITVFTILVTQLQQITQLWTTGDVQLRCNDNKRGRLKQFMT